MKIENEQQYQQSKDWLQQLLELLTELDGEEGLEGKGLLPITHQ